MTKVRLEYLIDKSRDEEVALENGRSVEDLLKAVGLTKDPDNYMVVVNGKNRFPTDLLNDGDRVKVFIAMSGG